jgi:very-short-patch-repair endonuclease
METSSVLTQVEQNAIKSELSDIGSSFRVGGYSLSEVRQHELRHHATPYEVLFKTILLNLRRQIPSLKFSSQFIVPTLVDQTILFFLVDFMISAPVQLAVEIDGSSHTGRESYDAWRTSIIENKGIRVVRFTNDEVSRNHGAIEYTLLQLLTNGGS